MVVAREQRKGEGIARAGARSSLATQAAFVLGLVAIGYAFLAGLRTLTVTDLGWQLATARWIVQHHEIPSTDVFSYTAQGQPWVYPVGSGLLFYGAYLFGGYTLLSWIQAAACAGTVALLVWRASVVSAVLAILAVPMIAIRTGARADMFSVVLFAAFLVLLWQQHQSGRVSIVALADINDGLGKPPPGICRRLGAGGGIRAGGSLGHDVAGATRGSDRTVAKLLALVDCHLRRDIGKPVGLGNFRCRLPPDERHGHTDAVDVRVGLGLVELDRDVSGIVAAQYHRRFLPDAFDCRGGRPGRALAKRIRSGGLGERRRGDCRAAHPFRGALRDRDRRRSGCCAGSCICWVASEDQGGKSYMDPVLHGPHHRRGVVRS